MDEGAPEEMTRMNWEKWYAEKGHRLNDAMVQDYENLETQIEEKLRDWPKEEPFNSMMAFATMIRGCLAHIRALLRRQEEDVAETGRTLEAINDFVKHYRPMLEELERERGFRSNIEGATQDG